MNSGLATRVRGRVSALSRRQAIARSLKSPMDQCGLSFEKSTTQLRSENIRRLSATRFIPRSTDVRASAGFRFPMVPRTLTCLVESVGSPFLWR